MAAYQLARFRPGRALLQDRDNLLFREPALASILPSVRIGKNCRISHGQPETHAIQARARSHLQRSMRWLYRIGRLLGRIRLATASPGTGKPDETSRRRHGECRKDALISNAANGHDGDGFPARERTREKRKREQQGEQLRGDTDDCTLDGRRLRVRLASLHEQEQHTGGRNQSQN